MSFGVLAAEGLLRVLGYSPLNVNPLRAFHQPDPLLIYRGRPNVEGRFHRAQFDITVRHDERGFRIPEFSRDRSTVETTLHVFGDSFTWGWGVETGEVFTDKLRHALPRAAVLNYGINGSGTALQAALLESEVRNDIRAGDQVLLMFFYNDFFDNMMQDRLHGRIEGDRVVEVVPPSRFGPSIGGWLKEHSYLANYAAHVWDLQKANWEAEAKRAAGDHRGREPDAETRRVTAHYLERFRDLCAACNAQLTIVWVPDLRDVAARAAGKRSGYFDAFTAITDPLGIARLDPTDALVAASANGNALYFDGDDHWTAAGHAAVAEFLASKLK